MLLLQATSFHAPLHTTSGDGTNWQSSLGDPSEPTRQVNDALYAVTTWVTVSVGDPRVQTQLVKTPSPWITRTITEKSRSDAHA
jgi:hypothetical protein